MLEVRLLGQFDVRLDGEPVEIASRPAQSLLAYLLLSAGTAHRREQLAGLLWPDATEANARANLRHALWHIRKALGASRPAGRDYLLADDLSIAFDAHSDYWLDVLVLDRKATRDWSADDLIGIVSVYEGELLPGFYDEWVVLERERLQAVFEQKMKWLLDRLVEARRWEDALEWGERWIALGQTPEPAYRALMIAHGALGDMSKVASVFERGVQAMRNDLGVEPSEQTRALYERLVGTSTPVLPTGTITFLFTDIEGSTRLIQRLGDEYAVVLADHRDLLRAAFAKWGGSEVEAQGDAFVVAFSSARNALACAVDAQRALAAHAWPPRGIVRVRMGLHTGTPLLARTGYVGIELHLAARIAGAGHGGQVLLSQATRDVIEGELPETVSLHDLGEYRLKDLPRPARIFQLVISGLPSGFPPIRSLDTREEPPAPRPSPPITFFAGGEEPPAPFVARERELARLDEFLGIALAGRGRVVFVTGEAGSGKTALVREFARRAQEAQADLVVASGNCDAQTGIGDPYLPFREALSLLSGDVEARGAGGTITRENASRLWAFMPVSAPALVDWGPDLIDRFVPGAALVSRAATIAPGGTGWLEWLKERVMRQMGRAGGAPPEQNRIFEQYTNVLQAMAAQRPLLLIVDDLHWADLSSISLLFHLVQRIKDSRILIVGTYRPEDVAQGGEGKPHPLQGVLSEFKRQFGDISVDLDRTTAVEGRRFVDALLDTEPNRLGEAFRQALFRHTEGHALFTTELLRDMQERDALERDEAGRWMERRALNWEKLPARVEGVIEKRIGRLAPELRRALRVASVEGEEFTAEVVARVQAVDEREFVQRLSGDLDRQHHLVIAQSLHRSGSQHLSHYRFRHNLFQQYLYNTLDEVERAYLHEQVGNVLEALYGDRTEQVAVQLTRHFQAAGIVDKAVDYLLEAGERARRLSANEEAIGHFNQGLALLQALPDGPERARRELALRIPLGNALIAAKGHTVPEVGQTFSRARELCRQIGDTPELFRVLSGLYRFYVSRGEAQIARELGEQLAGVAQKLQDPGLLTYSHAALGITSWYTGEFFPAQAHFEEGIASYDPKHYPAYDLLGEDPGVTCLCYAAWAFWILGYPDQALKKSEEALTLAQALSHPYDLAHALCLAALFHQFRRERQVAQARAEAAVTLSIEHGFPYWLAAGTVLRGWTLAEQGQGEQGIAQIREGLTAWRAMETEVGRTYFLALLAEAYQKIGQVEEGLRVVDEALTGLPDIGRWWEAELYRLKGELLLKDEGSRMKDESEACFLKAIKTARQQGAKSLELRAVMSLGRLWHSLRSQAKTEAARQMLADIYGWFSEGFDTADLKEARALLETLS